MYARIKDHWPEYAIEAWALGMFMVAACVATIALEYPRSPLHAALPSANVRHVLGGLAMGLTAIALIYSPWGKRSGAHMNPAVTLTFMRLGKIAPFDALCYIAAQFIGGTLGVYATKAVFAAAIADPAVNYAVTSPGPQGTLVAFLAEFAISAVLMTVVLLSSNSRRLAAFTGIFAGTLVATYIIFEGPYSGMSMNPARTFASAFPSGVWTVFWLYVAAPIAGMQLAAALFTSIRGPRAAACAKFQHPPTQRCIHCGFDPAAMSRESLRAGDCNV